MLVRGYSLASVSRVVVVFHVVVG